MTVIAWDGKTLAADRRSTNNGLIRSTTKIFRAGDRIIAVCGTLSYGLQMKAWIEEGCVVDKFPADQRHAENWQVIVVWDRHGLWKYEQTPYPLKVEESLFACGSGRDFALMALHLGKTATEAVELTALFDSACGNGVDALTLDKSAYCI